MSWVLETKNCGPVSDFGFMGPDTTKIMLGDLPGMPAGQFCHYAVETITSAFSVADDVRKSQMLKAIKGHLEWAKKANLGTGIRSTQNPLNLPRQQSVELTEELQLSDTLSISRVVFSAGFGEELHQAFSGEDQEVKDRLSEEYFLALNRARNTVADYPENPFKVEGVTITIGRMYVTDFTEFARFATNYIGGGMFGWDTTGIPDYAHKALQSLSSLVEQER